MATAKKKIKPLVSILPIEPKDVDRFWPLMEFMVAEALAFSGKYADAEWVFRELKKDIMQCWIMFGSDEFEENKVFGVCILKGPENGDIGKLVSSDVKKRVVVYSFS